MRVRAMRLGRFGDGAAGPVLPGYVLDELFASLVPLQSRVNDIMVAATTAAADDSAKAAWIGALNTATTLLQNASIDGQLGQKLAMGDVTVSQWAASPENAADLAEYVAKEIGISSYTVQRLWREVVIPTAKQVVQDTGDALKKAVDWGPWVLGGAAVLWLLWQFGPRRA